MSDNQRTELFVNNVYRGAYGRDGTTTEIQTQRDALNAAAAQGQSQVQSQAETFGRSLFAAQVSDYSISDQQFVTNLYESFLQRGPDAGGLGFWTSIAGGGSSNRQNVLNAFATCGSFYALADTLYREEFWLVADHLGTPRMIVDKSGSLAGVKRHDYLPFGEEIYANTGGRSATQGYAGDSTRQKFTGYEADAETGLNFAQARYQSPVQGRFTSVDPMMASASVFDPQSLNRYTYVQNNPMNFTDPTGMSLQDMGVLQTSDPAEAQSAQDLSLRKLQLSINDDYAARNGGNVSYSGSRATFDRLPSGSIVATVNIYGNFENVWGQPNFGAMNDALNGLHGMLFTPSLQAVASQMVLGPGHGSTDSLWQAGIGPVGFGQIHQGSKDYITFGLSKGVPPFSVQGSFNRPLSPVEEGISLSASAGWGVVFNYSVISFDKNGLHFTGIKPDSIVGGTPQAGIGPTITICTNCQVPSTGPPPERGSAAWTLRATQSRRSIFQ